MASDIILNGNDIELKGKKVTLSDTGGNPRFSILSSQVTVGNKDNSTTASVSVEDTKGRTYIRSNMVTTDQVHADKILGEEITLGSRAADTPRPSNLKLNNNNGQTSITLDGVNGNIKANGEVAGGRPYRNLSDVRCKNNILPLSNSLDILLKIQGVSFNWNEPGNNDAARQLGFVAQEVEKVLPELITKNEHGLSTMAYSELIPLLVESIKEQQQKISSLETTLTNIHQRLNRIEREGGDA